MLKAGLTAFITMIAILDPLGNVPTFLALSRSLEERLRRRAASQAVFTALAIIFGFALIGRLILRYLGVSLDSLSVAGGLLLALVALDMLRGRYDDPEVTERANIALVPLGTPLIAGPGAIAATMVLTERNHGSRLGRACGWGSRSRSGSPGWCSPWPRRSPSGCPRA